MLTWRPVLTWWLSLPSDVSHRLPAAFVVAAVAVEEDFLHPVAPAMEAFSWGLPQVRNRRFHGHLMILLAAVHHHLPVAAEAC